MPAANDYYRTLRVSRKASTEEIRRSFRRLAMQYHPDKNSDPLSVEKFTAIQAAYEVLRDAKKRAAYDYECYLLDPKRSVYTVAAAEDVLQLALKAERETARLDPFRVDRDLLHFRLMDILSEDNIRLLRERGDKEMIGQFVASIKNCLAPLPIAETNLILSKLFAVAGGDSEATHGLRVFQRHTQRVHQWNRYKVYIALAAAVAVCALMYRAGR